MPANVELIALTVDKHGGVTFCNDYFLRLTGWKREEVIGQDYFSKFIHEKDADVKKLFFDTIENGTIPSHLENPILTKSGGLRQIAWSNTMLRDGAGRIIGTASLAEDITERKRWEESLQKAEAKYRTIFENATEGIYQSTADGRFLSANPAMARILGYESPSELIGHRTDIARQGFANPGQRDEFKRTLEEKGSTTGFEYPALRRDGSKVWVSENAHSVRDAEGKLQYYEGTLTDINDRKAAEASLKANVAKLNGIFNTVPMGVGAASNRVIIETNEFMCQMLGYSREELTGKEARFLYPTAEDYDLTGREYRRLDESGMASLETRFRCKDGRIIEVAVSAALIDSGNPAAGVVSAVTDITSRKREQETLRESEERFQQLAAHVSKVFWMADKEITQMVYVSPAYEKIWGRTCQSLYDEPMSFCDAVHPEDRAAFAAILEQQKHGEPTEVEYRVVRPDGSVRWVRDRSFPVRNKSGEFYRTCGVAEDMTKRKHAAEEQLRLARQIELLLESTSEGIYSLDLDGRCLLFNQAGARMVGYSPEELLGAKVHALIHPHHADGSPCPENACCIIESIQEGKPCHCDTEIFWRKDGTFFSVNFSSHPIIEEGRIRGTVVVFSDITDKKALDEKLMRNQRIESIGMLAGGIAHDLNNVLAPIVMSLELLGMKFTDQSSREILATISSSAQRGADLVKQVLTFSRGIQGQRAPVQMGYIIREMKSIVSQTFPKSIQLRTETPTDLWLVRGDATQLHQVLMNLCVNARDAMPDGGMLTMKGENIILDEAFAQMNPEAKAGPYAALSVTDTGMGIASEVRKRIFEPFFTTKGIGKGTGLGLSTVLGIVKSHGGFVDIESKVGVGSCFKIYLPATGEAVAKALVDVACPLPKGNGELVIIADDEMSIREIGRQTLEMCGYQVLTASDGAAAIAVAAEHRDIVKLLITDMMMPIMDGPATIAALRHLIPGVKIIASSGLGSEIKESNPQKLGVNAFLRKPFTAETLAQTVCEVLSGDPVI